MNKVVAVIQNTLTRHRTVFWYEVSAEFKALRAANSLLGVEILEFTNKDPGC